MQECITSAAQGYAETLHSLAKRKEWSVKALQTQQDQIQDVFTELKSKMQAEFRVTMKEVSHVLARSLNLNTKSLTRTLKVE